MAGRSIIRLPFFISVINVCADFAPAVDARIVAGLVVTSVSGTEPGRTVFINNRRKIIRPPLAVNRAGDLNRIRVQSSHAIPSVVIIHGLDDMGQYYKGVENGDRHAVLFREMSFWDALGWMMNNKTRYVKDVLNVK